MALSIRDKLFITFTDGDTRRARVTRRAPWARPHRVADRQERMDERARGREREGGRGEGRGGPPRRLSKPIFGISFGKHNVLRTLFMGSIRNLSPGDPALHSHTKGERRSTIRCCNRYTNRRVRSRHLRGPRLIGYRGLDPFEYPFDVCFCIEDISGIFFSFFSS